MEPEKAVAQVMEASPQGVILTIPPVPIRLDVITVLLLLAILGAVLKRPASLSTSPQNGK